jgi:four helix bundle protein
MNFEEPVFDLKVRTKDYALQVIALVRNLKPGFDSSVLGKQLIRSATSVGAQYREAQRAKSNADFVTKVEGCLQELEETRYWLELLEGSGLIAREAYVKADDEADQLTAIFTTIVKKVKAKPKP